MLYIVLYSVDVIRSSIVVLAIMLLCSCANPFANISINCLCLSFSLARSFSLCQLINCICLVGFLVNQQSLQKNKIYGQWYGWIAIMAMFFFLEWRHVCLYINIYLYVRAQSLSNWIDIRKFIWTPIFFYCPFFSLLFELNSLLMTRG